MIKKLLYCLLLLLPFLSAKAQNDDDKLTYRFNYGKSKSTGAIFMDNAVSLGFPIKAGEHSTFTITPEFGVLDISHTGSVADSNSLKTLGVKIGYRTIINGKTVVSIHVEPLIASDFVNITGQDFRFRSGVIFLLNAEKKFAIGLGIDYQYQFSGSQILPLFTTLWRINDKVTLSGAIPLIPRLTIKLDDKWSIGAGINGDYSSYRLSAFNNQYTQLQNFSFGFTSKYKATKHLELGAFLGYGIRRLDVYNADQKIPLRIYGWDIGGGSHTPVFEQKFNGVALNFTLAYKI